MTPRLLILLGSLFAFNLCQAQSGEINPQRQAMVGLRLNVEQVSALEAAVTNHPDDLSARTKLLGYYFQRQHSSPEANAARQKHIFWIIQNQPEANIAGLPYSSLNALLDGDAYWHAKQLWLAQTKTHDQNPKILGNAAQFFLIHDRDIAENLFNQAQKIEPNSPHWSDQLGHLYALSQIDGKSAAAKSLAAFEKAQANDPSESSRFSRLDDLAKQSFEAGEIKKASKYANDLLAAAQTNPTNWNHGNAIFYGNNVLGRIALQQGEVEKAVQYLLDSGNTTGSPQLNSFGPNMRLAKELLGKGESDAVLQYFKLCRKFWSMGDEKLNTWTKEVRAGDTPDFGANLSY